MRYYTAALLLSLATACLEEDYDADGYGVSEDCDDHRATLHPGATELCNGLDEDCDGIIDNGGFGPGDGIPGSYFAAAYYPDRDGDGFGDPASELWACDVPFPGAVTNGNDCDDTRYQVHPGADEICGGLDYDCDGRAAPECDPADFPPP